MQPIAFIGYSGSGKTTLIEALVRISAARGEEVAVLKHTHHPANTERRGDTGRFLDAGAKETILASEDGRAAHSDGSIFTWDDPRALLSRFSARRIYVEGFRTTGLWPSVLVHRSSIGRPALDPANLIAVVSDAPVREDVPAFPFDAQGAVSSWIDGWLGLRSARYEAIVFDLDGTLIDSYAALATAINRAREEHRMAPLEEAAIRAAVGEGIERLLEQTFEPGFPPSVRTSFERHYDEVCCTESRVLEHVAETLASIQQRGVRMGVCTNKPTAFSKKILDYLGLSPRFAAVVGPDLAGARKPDGRHVLETLRMMDRKPGEALFVGDMPIDVAAARAAGVEVAVLPTGVSPREQLVDSRPDYLLDRFSDLLSLLARRESRKEASA